jgi:hypothetical protein
LGNLVIAAVATASLLAAYGCRPTDDENSYEYPSPDRAAQYDGDLHGTTARPFMEQTLR